MKSLRTVARSPRRAEKPQARGAIHQQSLFRAARAHPYDVVGARIHERVDVRAVAPPDGMSAAASGEGLAGGGEHGDRVGGLALERLQQRIAVLEAQLRHVEPVAGARADPALARKDHAHRLLDHGALHLRTLGGLDERAPLVSEFLRILDQFGYDELLQLLLVAEDVLQAPALGLERLPLVVQRDAVGDLVSCRGAG